MTSLKLSHYFDEHPIKVVNSVPLSDILNNPGAIGRVAQWNIEISPCDLCFKHPTTIKAQVLPDFIVEWMEVQTPGPLIRPKRVYNLCLSHAYIGDFAICFATL